jgi:chemotaxis protein CheC
MSTWDSFQELQLDVLKEVGNIGAGNAATALSKLLNKMIDMKVPSVSISTFDGIADHVGGPEEVVVTVFLKIEGEITGNMFFILQQEGAKQLIESIIGPSEGEGYSEMEVSALQEVGNILCGSYLSALSDLTKLNLYPSVPALAIDMAAAILSYGLIEFSKLGDYALLIDTSFLDITSGNEASIKGHFFLLPDPGSFAKLFSALGVPFYE